MKPFMTIRFLAGISAILFLSAHICHAEELRNDFSDASSVRCDPAQMEAVGGVLRLSPTASWTNLSSAFAGPNNPHTLFRDSEGIFYLTAEETTTAYNYRSTNNGTNWVLMPPFELGHTYNFIEVSNRILYAAGGVGFASGDGIFKSTNRGANWLHVYQPVNQFRANAVLHDSSGSLFGCGRQSQNPPLDNRFVRSTDQGASWNIVHANFNEPCFFGLMELTNGPLITASTNGLFISSNKGTNWTVISNTRGLRTYMVSFTRTGNGTLFAAGVYPGYLARSADNGLSWEQILTGACGKLIEAQDSVLYLVKETNIWKSPDAGATWIKTPELRAEGNLFYNLGSCLVEAPDGRLYTAGFNYGLNAGYFFTARYPVQSTATLYFSPPRVRQWTSMEKSEQLNGGQTVYEFSYSTNSGSQWSPWLAAGDDALKSIPCHNAGQDLLKLKITLLSKGRTATPRVDYVALNYTSGTALNVADAVLAPNPYRPGKDKREAVTFFRLPSRFRMTVYSKTGAELFSQEGSTETGEFAWIPKNAGNGDLKSGVYLIRLSDESGKSRVLKLVIIR